MQCSQIYWHNWSATLHLVTQLNGRVMLVFGENWQDGSASFQLGFASRVDKETDKPIVARPRDLLVSRVSAKYFRTRADVMSVVVHELRHAGQAFNFFATESIKGVSLSCSTVTGHVSEVDALLAENHWLVSAIGITSEDTVEAKTSFNSGRMWTADDIWDHDQIRIYKYVYQKKYDDEPVLRCF